MRAFILTIAALTLFAAPASPAWSQDDIDDEDSAAAMDFAMHDATFTLYHEIGHLLVGELGLPVLGKEEDAADALATVLLLTDEEDDDSYNALVDSADGWYFNAVNSTGQGVEDLSYYDEHSLDIQRAYAMVCLMVGKDPEAFAQTAEAYDLDQDRIDACAYTYEQAQSSWEALLEPYVVGDETGAEITVVYEDGGDYEAFAAELQAREVLERAAALVTGRYMLPEPVTFRAAVCGEANAYYSPSDHEVVYCYDLAADLYTLYIYDILGSGSDDDEEEE